MSFFNELKRRNVFRVAAAYAVAAWLLVEVFTVIVDIYTAPDWIMKVFVAVVVVGFPVALMFSWVYEITPDGLKREQDVERDPSVALEAGKRLDLITIVLLVLAVAFVVYDRNVREPNRIQVTTDEPEPPAVAATEMPEPATGDDRPSIAVIPFANLSAEAENEYFSDGITEELLNALAKMGGLRVAARTSSFQFKGKDVGIADVAGALNVSHVLEGSVRRAGDQVRITAQLINAEDGFQLWSDTYDRQLDDIFAIQGEIAAAIGQALKATLQIDSGPPTRDLEAYDLYLLGRFHFEQRTQEKLEQARRYFEQAIELDPGFAMAHVGLADTLLLLENNLSSYGDLDPEVVQRLARPAVARALEIDPDLAEAHATQAMLHSRRGEFQAAIEAIDRAVELNPNQARAWHWREVISRRTGRFSESLRSIETAVALDPLAPILGHNYALVLADRGRYAEGEAVALALQARSPDSPFGYRAMGFVQYARGDVAGALQSMESALRVAPTDPLSGYLSADALFHLGLFERLEILLGNAAQALVHLGHRRGPEALAAAKAAPGIQSLRFRYADILALAGLPEQALDLLQPLADVSSDPYQVANMMFEDAGAYALALVLNHRQGNRGVALKLRAGLVGFLQATDLKYPELPVYWAAVRLAEDRQDAAVRELERAFEDRWRSRDLAFSSLYEDLRGRDDFQALTERMLAELERQRARYLQASLDPGEGSP